MKKENQSSLVDLLMNNMQFGQKMLIPLSTNSKQAKNLYSIFINATQSDNVIKMGKPLEMPMADFVELRMSGLISGSNEEVFFTKQGQRMLEKMILADDDCTFALKTNVDKGLLSKKSQENNIDGLLPKSPGIFRL